MWQFKMTVFQRTFLNRGSFNSQVWNTSEWTGLSLVHIVKQKQRAHVEKEKMVVLEKKLNFQVDGIGLTRLIKIYHDESSHWAMNYHQPFGEIKAVGPYIAVSNWGPCWGYGWGGLQWELAPLASQHDIILAASCHWFPNHFLGFWCGKLKWSQM